MSWAARMAAVNSLHINRLGVSAQLHDQRNAGGKPRGAGGEPPSSETPRRDWEVRLGLGDEVARISRREDA